VEHFFSDINLFDIILQNMYMYVFTLLHKFDFINILGYRYDVRFLSLKNSRHHYHNLL